MALTEPGKITTPWANSGLKNTIPGAANPVTGSAGYDLGFPPVTMTPPEAGGIPPQGQDFNGILYAVTQILQFIQAGGVPTFSAALASSAGGYAKGAIVMSTNGITLWQNMVSGNTTDPDAGGPNWVDAVLRYLPKRIFGANDYVRIPDVDGGLIIQWCLSGTVVASGGGNVTFPIAFPNGCIFCTASPLGGTPNINAGNVVAGTPSATGSPLYNWGPISAPAKVLAFGY